jgi:hypothetical protein
MITALDKFHEARGRYPTNLIELVPVYFPDSRVFLVSGKAKSVRSPHAEVSAEQSDASKLDWFRYNVRGDSYSLMFNYAGWYMHAYAYDSKTMKWTSSGYY